MPPVDQGPATTDPATTMATGTATGSSARILAFPAHRVVRADAPPPRLTTLAATLRHAADALGDAVRRLDDQGRDLEAARGGFADARRLLAAESDRARTIAADGARIAAAIEGGDLDALLALRGELEQRLPTRR